MRLFVMLTVFVLTVPVWAQSKDHDARERIVKLEQQYNSLKERQLDIKNGIDQVNQKLELLIHGNGKPGITEQIALNTAFRKDMQKLFWALVSAFVVQFVVTVLNFTRLRKILKE